MNRRLFATLSLVALAVGCAIDPIEALRQSLIGSWKQEIHVLGEDKTSVLTFRSDGTFVEAVHAKTPLGQIDYVPLVGTWRALSAGSIEMTYPKGFTGYDKSETEERRITLVTKDAFVSADSKYGISVRRSRVLEKAPKT